MSYSLVFYCWVYIFETVCKITDGNITYLLACLFTCLLASFLPSLPTSFLPSFLPYLLTYLLILICIILFLWYRIPCNGVDCLIFSLTTTTSSSAWHIVLLVLLVRKLYYFVDGGPWRRDVVTPFNWLISSYSFSWLANISFVWTTNECFHQTTKYFFTLLKQCWQTGKRFLHCFNFDLYLADLISAAPQWTQTSFVDLDSEQAFSMRQLHLRFAAVYRDLESKSIPQVEMMSSRSWWFEGESWENCMLFVICAISFNKNHCRRRFFNFSVAVLYGTLHFLWKLMKTIIRTWYENCLRICSTYHLVTVAHLEGGLNQFVVFTPLRSCFEEIIGFDVKASFARSPLSRLIKPGDILKEC